MSESYYSIVRHYEQCFERYGDTPEGVGHRPGHSHVDLRYEVFLDVIRTGPEVPVTLLEFGCGASHLYEYIRRHNLCHLSYAGLDLSEKFVAHSRRKFPDNQYYCLDILKTPDLVPEFDYVVMPGVVTQKVGLSYEDMLEYFQRILVAVFAKARVGLAFDVISKQVDWERDDLFHLPLDTLAWFLKKELTRHFLIRNDYGLYTYTTYVYREPISTMDPARHP